MHAIWYFDFISPYAYFSSGRLGRLPAGTQVHYRPVLLAGLLNHWGQKGPAELAPKRVWTYRACIWYAQQHGIAFRLPAAHPFNPLPYLRLCLAAGVTPHAVRTIFDALWTTGCDPADATVVRELAERLHVDVERLADVQIKDALRTATEEAIRAGVFGVPTLRIDTELFWGNDAVEFAAAYLADPTVLDAAEMQRATSLPVGVTRTGA